MPRPVPFLHSRESSSGDGAFRSLGLGYGKGLVLMGVGALHSYWICSDAASPIEEGESMSRIIKKLPNGVTVTRCLTAIGDCWNLRWYDPEFHHNIGDRKCSICGRLFPEHDQNEFCDHWDEIAARAELPTEVISMKEFQQRAMDERMELSERIYKLSAFLKSEMFQSLPSDEQERLQRQLEIMVQYHTILADRIANFPQE
jgi:hypothetical protein